MIVDRNKKNEAYIRASSHFLTDEYPANWQDMAEEELLKFIEENQWHHFEGCDPEYVWEHIENLAQDFINFASKAETIGIKPTTLGELTFLDDETIKKLQDYSKI